MAGRASIHSEIVGRTHKSLTEVKLPDSIDHYPSRQWIRWTTNPPSKRSSALGASGIGFQTKISNKANRIGTHKFSWRHRIAAGKSIGRLRW